MFRRALEVATVVAVAIGTMQVPAAAQAKPADGPGGAAVDDCAAATRASAAAMRRAARTDAARLVCLSRQPPAGVTGPPTRTQAGPVAPTGPTKAARKPSGVRTAAADCPEGSWGITRFDVCTTMPGYINIWKWVCVQGSCSYVVVGWLEVKIRLRSDAWPHSASWQESIEIWALNASDEGHDGVYISGVTGCEGGCQPTNFAFPSQLLQVGRKISGWGALLSSAAGTVDAQAFGHGTFTIDIRAVRPGIPGSHTVRVDPVTRCDTVASTTAGCVYPDAGLVYGLPGDLYPEVANHVLQAQNSGLIGRDVPLTRMINQGREENNRYIACNPSRPRPGGLDCDEYPFASTYEGAAMWGNTGRRTFPGCGRSDLPEGVTGPQGWSACLVWSPDNRGQGADLGRFYINYRVIDGDDFYVEVD
jgi:hypothetical protein